VVEVLRSVYDAMLAHALDERPDECCGMLAGTHGRVTHVLRATNVADRKGVRYEVAPREILRILDEIDDAKLDHLGIYHSHTFTRAYPSATDIGLAAYPVYYFIVSLADFRKPIVKAFTITDGEVSEQLIEVVAAESRP
jgi:proteasome lid subunit RPN8/RPN11